MKRHTVFAGAALRIAATTVAAAALGLSVASGAAATPTIDPNAAKSAQITLVDLDLSKPADMVIARARVHQQARKLCERLEDMLSLSHQPDYVACVDAATANAEPVLQRLAADKTTGLRVANSQR